MEGTADTEEYLEAMHEMRGAVLQLSARLRGIKKLCCTEMHDGRLDAALAHYEQAGRAIEYCKELLWRGGLTPEGLSRGHDIINRNLSMAFSLERIGLAMVRNSITVLQLRLDAPQQG